MPARHWVRFISILVPGDDRQEWIEEWEGELEAEGSDAKHAWGALPDAWYLRTEGWTMDRLFRETRFAVRALIRRPFFTALAGLTLAVGIGANTAIFSVVDGVLLNPLPYPQPGELVSVNHVAPGLNLPMVPHSEGTYLHYREGLRTLEGFAVFERTTLNLLTGGDPRRIAGAAVTEDFFRVMGVQPSLGRAFSTGEDRVGSEPVAILSQGLWREAFGGDAAVMGQVVEMSGVQRRVVGIMPEGFEFPTGAEIWTPMPVNAIDPDMGSLGLIGIGRLAEGVPMGAAQSEMGDLLTRLTEVHPEEFPAQMLEQAGMAPDVKPLKDLFVQDVEQALWILLGTVGFVLLIACANVANLFLVRAESRQREQALRTAIGATRRDMVRQYLTESVALALGSGLLGLGLAAAGVKVLLASAPVAVPRIADIGIDGSVLAFTALISLGAGLLFGLFPAFGHARRDLSGALKEGGRSSTSGRERHRARSTLVVAQVALALMLLVGSGLMARSFLALRTVDPGFDSSDRLTFRLSLPEAEFGDAGTVMSFHRRLQERMAAIPGVGSAAIVSAVPLADHKNASPMEAEDNPHPEDQLAPLVDARLVSPGYFETLGITMVEGRELSWEDAGNAQRSVVVSETLARTYWPGEASVLGRRIRQQGDDSEAWEVVGVAGDVRFETLNEDPGPIAYFPLVAGDPEEPIPTWAVAVVLQAGTDPLGLVGPAREALKEVGPRLPMVAPRTLESVERDAMAATSFTVLLLGIAAAIALLLGTVGIYGVVSYVVSRRTQEIGVRMALGAPGASVLREVVGQGMGLAGLGVVLGLFGAWGVSRVLSSLLFGVSPTDPLTYAGTAGALTLVALLASWIPARKAARIDPVEALRQE